MDRVQGDNEEQRGAARWHVPLPSLHLAIAMPALAFLILPILVVVPMSFTNGGIVEFPPRAWGLDAYREVLEDSTWVTAILFSLEVAGLAVAISVMSAGLATVGTFKLPSREQGIIAAVLLIPLSIPTVVLALGSFQLFNEWHITGTLLAFAFAHSVLGAPYVFLTVRAALSRLNPALVQSAVSLGAGNLSLIRWVYLPATVPALLSGALLVFVVSFDEVVVALFISGPAAITFPVKLFTELQFELSPAIMAVSTLLLGVVVVVVLASVAVLGSRRTVYRIALGTRAE